MNVLTWEQINDEVLPKALMIGVSYELFWELNPTTLTPFVKAFSLKQQYDDTLAWQHGLYVSKAISACFSKQEKYPSKPIFTSDKKELTPEEKQKQIRERFLAHAKALNAKMGRNDLLDGK